LNDPEALEADVRVDVWLWASRFFKTRALSRQAIENGKVSVNGQRPRPSRRLHLADQLEVERSGERFHIEVIGLSDQRGPAVVAQTLYRESDASKAAREAERELRRAAAKGFTPSQGRPDKRARRLIRALGDLDAL